MGGYAPRAQEDIVRPRRLIGAPGRPLNFTVRRSLWTPKLSEELEMSGFASRMREIDLGGLGALAAIFARASRVRVRQAAASIQCGARANADLFCSSRAFCATRQARSASVLSAVARLPGDYVVLGCASGAARAQWWPVRATSNNRWRGP